MKEGCLRLNDGQEIETEILIWAAAAWLPAAHCECTCPPPESGYKLLLAGAVVAGCAGLTGFGIGGCAGWALGRAGAALPGLGRGQQSITAPVTDTLPEQRALIITPSSRRDGGAPPHA